MPEELDQAEAGQSEETSDTDATSSEAEAPSYADRYGDDVWPDSARQQINSLRQENQTYRERYGSWEQATSGMHPDDAEAFRGLAQLVAQGDPNAAYHLTELALAYGQNVGIDPNALLGQFMPQQQQPQYQVGPDGQYYDPNQVPMTRAEFEAALAQRESEAAQQAQVSSIEADVAAHFDPQRDWAGYADVLRRAASTGDVAGAIESVKNERADLERQAVDRYLAAKRTDANGTTVAPSDGAPPTGGKPPAVYGDDMWAAVESRLEAMAP